MTAPKWRWSPPRYAGSDHQIRHSLAGVDKSKNSISGPNLKQIPSRATLARRLPGLRINRLNWRWIDDASRAKGEDFRSLLAFLNEGGSAR